MRMEQIKYFLYIAQSESISRTAEHFYISQQAVSEAMKRLEEEFNCKLFRRRKNGVAITENGQIFLREANRIMEAYLRLQMALNPQYQEKSQLQGNLQIMVHPRLYHLGLKSFLQQFMSKYPGVRISFFEGDNQQIGEAVQLKQADFGLAFGRGIFPQETSRLQKGVGEQALCQDGVYICCTAPHPLAGHGEIALEELGRYAVTSFAAKSFIDSYYRTQLDKRDNIFFCSESATQCDVIRSGTAAGVLTGYEYRTFFKNEDQITAVLVKDQTAEVILIYPLINEQKAIFEVFVGDIVAYYDNWSKACVAQE